MCNILYIIFHILYVVMIHCICTILCYNVYIYTESICFGVDAIVTWLRIQSCPPSAIPAYTSRSSNYGKHIYWKRIVCIYWKHILKKLYWKHILKTCVYIYMCINGTIYKPNNPWYYIYIYVYGGWNRATPSHDPF